MKKKFNPLYFIVGTMGTATMLSFFSEINIFLTIIAASLLIGLLYAYVDLD